MNLEHTMLSERSQTQDKQCAIPLTGGPQRSRIHRDRFKEMVGPGAGRGERWGVSVLWGQRVSLGREESSGDRWWGWWHSNVHVLNATELCLRMIKTINFT